MQKELKGYVEYIDNQRIKGWAISESIDGPLNLDVYQEDELILSLTAKLFRDGIAKSKLSTDGYCGFDEQFRVTLDTTSNISVRWQGQELAYAPKLRNITDWNLEVTDKYKTKGEELFYFIHVPKTAGTTFRFLLEKEFNSSETLPSQKDIVANGGRYPNLLNIKKLLDKKANKVRFFTGHYPFIMHNIFKTNVNKLIFLRNPTDRVISNIFHMKNNDPRLKDLDPEEIFEKGFFHFSNLQTRQLVDNNFDYNMLFFSRNKIPGNLFIKAKLNLDKCDFVGITEYFEASILLANKMFDLNLNPNRKENVTRKKYEISSVLLDRINKLNRMDQKLYKLATQKFKYLCMLYDIPIKSKTKKIK